MVLVPTDDDWKRITHRNRIIAILTTRGRDYRIPAATLCVWWICFCCRFGLSYSLARRLFTTTNSSVCRHHRHQHQRRKNLDSNEAQAQLNWPSKCRSTETLLLISVCFTTLYSTSIYIYIQRSVSKGCNWTNKCTYLSAPPPCCCWLLPTLLYTLGSTSAAAPRVFIRFRYRLNLVGLLIPRPLRSPPD